MLPQVEIGRFFDQCEDALAIEEVLSAYVVCKYMKGRTSPQVMQKLRYLTIYLRITNRAWVLQRGADPFRVIGAEVARGGGRIGVSPAMTKPGRAVCNHIRRHTPGLSTDSQFGGPYPLNRLLQNAAVSTDSEVEPWVDRWFHARPQYETLNQEPDYVSLRGTLPAYNSQGRGLPSHETSVPSYTSVGA